MNSIRHNMAKVSRARRKCDDETVRAIRRDLAAGVPQVECARKHSVSADVVRNIVRGKSYAGVYVDPHNGPQEAA